MVQTRSMIMRQRMNAKKLGLTIVPVPFVDTDFDDEMRPPPAPRARRRRIMSDIVEEELSGKDRQLDTCLILVATTFLTFYSMLLAYSLMYWGTV